MYKEIKLNKGIYLLNVFLLSAVVLAVIGYVLLSNFLASGKYGLDMLRKQYSRLNAESYAVEASEHSLEELLLFAQKSGMVEAKSGDSILGDNGLATRTQF